MAKSRRISCAAIALACAAAIHVSCVRGKTRPTADGDLGQADGALGDRTVRLTQDEPNISFEFADLSDQPAGPLAVCDLNGDTEQDIVLAFPDAAGPFEAAQPAFGQVVVLAGPDFGVISETTDVGKVISIGRTNQAGKALALLRVHGAAAGDRLGESLVCADLNADGSDDLILGAPRADNGRGHVYVIRGSNASASVIDLSEEISSISRLRGAQDQDALGTSLAVAKGPLSTERLTLAVGVPGFDGLGEVSRIDAGAVWMLLGSINLPNELEMGAGEDRVVWLGARAGNRLGTALTAGRFHAGGTGADDIAATAPGTNSGAVRVLSGSELSGDTVIDAALTDQAGATILGDDAAAQFGSTLAAVDLVGSDGAQELLIGAPNADRRGAVYVFDGGSLIAQPSREYSVADQDYRIVFVGPTDSRLGVTISRVAGPFAESAGIDDVVFGAPGASSATGEVFWVRPDSGYAPAEVITLPDDAQLQLTVIGARRGDQLGAALAVGQLNEMVDGVADLLIADSIENVVTIFGR